jgi:hypothetical protein
MSWQDDLQDSVFEIVTGDGRSYFPKWRNAIKVNDYNVTVYDFIDVQGSYVDRKEARGRRFALEFYFDGENAVAEGNNFEISARDKRKWLLKHPFYGDIYCQPLGMLQDNSTLNVSKFIGEVIETIGEGYPKYENQFEDIIVQQHESTNELQAEAFAVADDYNRNALEDVAERLDTIFEAIMDDENQLNEFKAEVDGAVRDITNVLSSATNIVGSLQDLINYPATIVQTIEARFGAFTESLEMLIDNITGIELSSRSTTQKTQFEILAGSIIAAQMLSSVSNIEDGYKTRSDVIDIQERLLANYDSYLEIVEANQTARSDTPDTYMPDFDSLNALASLTGVTLANLYTIAFAAKQERAYVLGKDSNAILLTHKFYGLDLADENLEYFINTNDIGLNEILNIEKGRQVIYYV